mgnify:FL=1
MHAILKSHHYLILNLIEAMAHGKIILGSAVGGISEIIGTNKNGFLFNPNDINDFKLSLGDAISAVINGGCYNISINEKRGISFIYNSKANAIKRLVLITR